MTVAIKQSLSKLNNALQGLEQSAVEANNNQQQLKQQMKKKSSPDLFSVPKMSGAEDDVDTKALANRLDGAIARIEEMLEEGA